MSFYVLLRKKNSKKIVGAIPTKKGSKLASIRKQIRKDGLHKILNVRIITEKQFLKLKARRIKAKLIKERHKRISKRKK